MTIPDEDKPWSGRFTQPTDAFVEQFSASVHFDQRLYACDIRGSIAHATMLAEVGVLTPEEREKIVKGLEDILIDIERGDFAWLRELEDVHMNIEARLTDRIGDVGKKLHTGRSRNDQRSMRSSRPWNGSARRSSTSPSARPTPSCPVTRTCSRRSRSPSAITCWRGWRCCCAIARACSMRAGA